MIEIIGKVFTLQHLKPSQIHRAFQHILQFTHITGPVVFHQALYSFGGDSGNLQIQLEIQLFYQVVDKHWNVLAPLPQRRNANPNNIQAIIEVTTEFTFLNHLLQGDVSGGNDTSINGNDGRGTDALNLAFLKNTQ